MKTNNDKFVLIDTCTFSNIMNGNWKTHEYRAFAELFKTENKMVISDLTMAEQIEGARNLQELRKLLNDLDNCEFLIFGHNLEFANVLTRKHIDNTVKNDNDFLLFKKYITKSKNKIIRPLFVSLLKIYTLLFFEVLAVNDLFFGNLFISFVNVLNHNDREFANIGNILFDDYILGNVSSNNILFDFSCSLAEEIMQNIDSKFSKEMFNMKLNSLNPKGNLPRLTSNFIKTTKNFQSKEINLNFPKDKSNILFLMKYLKKNFKDSFFENELQFDALIFCVIKSGFCEGKFHFNDLVDSYNASLIANDKINFIYFTSDNKWNNFYTIESQVNDKFKNLYDKLY